MINKRLAQLQALLADDPNSSFILFAIAKEQEKLSQYELALEAYLKIVEKDPKYVGTYYHLAKLYEEQSNTEKALLTYEAGIVIAKDIKDLHALSELQNAKMNLEME